MNVTELIGGSKRGEELSAMAAELGKVRRWDQSNWSGDCCCKFGGHGRGSCSSKRHILVCGLHLKAA